MGFRKLQKLQKLPLTPLTPFASACDTIQMQSFYPILQGTSTSNYKWSESNDNKLMHI